MNDFEKFKKFFIEQDISFVCVENRESYLSPDKKTTLFKEEICGFWIVLGGSDEFFFRDGEHFYKNIGKKSTLNNRLSIFFEFDVNYNFIKSAAN